MTSYSDTFLLALFKNIPKHIDVANKICLKKKKNHNYLAKTHISQ